MHLEAETEPAPAPSAPAASSAEAASKLPPVAAMPGSRDGSRSSIDVWPLLSGTFASRDDLGRLSYGSVLGSGGTLSSIDTLLGEGASQRYLGPRPFPMLAVVRLEHIKHALLLGAVDSGAKKSHGVM